MRLEIILQLVDKAQNLLIFQILRQGLTRIFIELGLNLIELFNYLIVLCAIILNDGFPSAHFAFVQILISRLFNLSFDLLHTHLDLRVLSH